MPSLLPDFEYDIFISYRQNDNKYDGWVTEFVKNLNKELEATLKDKINVYFDSNPHDGLLETHSVNHSLEPKLKCLIFIPILSKTYCDPNGFAWQHEFLPFISNATQDRFGLNIRLNNGNVSSRVLPVKIHDLDSEDSRLAESHIGPIRSIEFIYHSPGVNRSLRPWDDDVIKNTKQPIYRDQINKVANTIDEILRAIRSPAAIKIIEKRTPARSEVKESFIAKSEIEVKQSKSRYTRAIIIGFATALLIGCGILLYRWYDNKQHIEYARLELLPQIEKSVREELRPTFEIYRSALEARKWIKNDSLLNYFWGRITVNLPIETIPSGAELFWKDYAHPEMEWESLGVTPIKQATLPRRYVQLQFRKTGYQTVDYAGPVAYEILGKAIAKVQLDAEGSIPEGMVRVPQLKTSMYIIGLQSYGPATVGEFFVDKFEVTNKQYKAFIDAGGYTNQSFWKYPIYKDDLELSFNDGMNLFLDKTGRKGPSSWEAGTYPDGLANHPVNGVSWYEASAYATYAGKELPSVYHWSIFSETSRAEFIIPRSNYSGKGTTVVGSLANISSFGVYDVAGNVREWCVNKTPNGNQRFILGGGWNDLSYTFNDAYTQSAVDRNVVNGFRCIKELKGDSTLNKLHSVLTMSARDYKKERPVDEKSFEIIKRQYAYDKTPLNDSLTVIQRNDLYRIERVTFDAAYNHERMQAYLYIPKNAKVALLPVVFFPPSNAIQDTEFNFEFMRNVPNFIVKSGRVLVVPVLKGTYERHDELKSDVGDESVFYRDHVIMWGKDLGRTIDYLETRKDIRSDKIAYFGMSWGGSMGSIMSSIEKRFKTMILTVGGLTMYKALPEADPINFAPRVMQPTLMINAKYDMFVPVEASQKPLFEFLGTPADEKKIFIYESGHAVPREEMMKETLHWLDKYQAMVE